MLADLGWSCLPAGAQKVVDSSGADDDGQRHRENHGRLRALYPVRGFARSHLALRSAARLFLERLSISRKCVPSGNLTKPSGLPNRIEVPGWSRNAGRLANQRRSVGNARLPGYPGSRLASGCVLGNRAFQPQPPRYAIQCNQLIFRT